MIDGVFPAGVEFGPQPERKSWTTSGAVGLTNEVTQILEKIRAGDAQAASELLPLVYQELRRLAARRLSAEQPGQTLQATALVHEAYMRLVGRGGAEDTTELEATEAELALGRASGADPVWQNRAHFYGAASEAMRRILIEVARKKNRRGGPTRSLVDEPLAESSSLPPLVLLEVDEAICHLAEEDPVKAQLVKLRFYGGLTMIEAAQCLGISRATADRYWAFARAWLFERLESQGVERCSVPR